jgi:hypothetical protein
METNPTQTPIKKFKLLLITDTRGIQKHVPFNKANKDYYTAYKSTLTKDKREKYLIEEVDLSIEEAAAIGIAEAYSELYPVQRKQQSNQSNDIVAMLLKQNQELAERLAVIESVKKGGKNG